MKKLAFLIIMSTILLGFSGIRLATEDVETQEEMVVLTAEDSRQNDEAVTDTKTQNSDAEEKDMGEASTQVIGAMNKKEERIKVLTQKFNDKTLAVIAYWLEVVRFYSTPIFFIFLTIGAFNFFIVGNKKLDKKEQGFGWMTACIIGWVVFQCIPLVFTLVTLGVTK